MQLICQRRLTRLNSHHFRRESLIYSVMNFVKQACVRSKQARVPLHDEITHRIRFSVPSAICLTPALTVC